MFIARIVLVYNEPRLCDATLPWNLRTQQTGVTTVSNRKQSWNFHHVDFFFCKRHAASVAPFIENTRVPRVTVLTQCYTHARWLPLISLQSPAQVRGLCNICCGRQPLSVTACWGIQLMLLVFDVKGMSRGGGRGSEIKYINPGQRLPFLSCRLPNLFVSAWGH